MIPYGKQDITQADIDAVCQVLKSDFITQGDVVPQFESEIARICQAEFAVAVNSATSALHLACLALGVTAGDVVWTTPVTFVASANCALYCGAQIDFVDIDPVTYNLSTDALEEKLKRCKQQGRPLPKVVIPVHLCGQSCDMLRIYELSQEYGFTIIEDASHAIGGCYKSRPIGCCQYSDITVFSFHPVKIITTGEGGMALTNQSNLADKMQMLRSHGVTRDTNKMTKVADGGWYYQQLALGFNYRMTDIQAALGLSQAKRLSSYIKKRHQLAQVYNEALANLPLTLPKQHADCYSAYHLYVIRLQLKNIKISHKQFFEALRADGVGVNLHYIPVHTQPFYQRLGFKLGDFPEAEKYYQEAISLPMFAVLSDEAIKRVVFVVKSIIEK